MLPHRTCVREQMYSISIQSPPNKWTASHKMCNITIVHQHSIFSTEQGGIITQNVSQNKGTPTPHMCHRTRGPPPTTWATEQGGHHHTTCATEQGGHHHTTCATIPQLGPRMTLQLVKIEEGFCDGEVLHHEFSKWVIGWSCDHNAPTRGHQQTRT